LDGIHIKGFQPAYYGSLKKKMGESHRAKATKFINRLKERRTVTSKEIYRG